MLSPKDQGTCLSCWSFAAVAAVEALYAKKFNKIMAFSEQQVVDCDRNNWGCNGGWSDRALTYIQNNGLQAASTYSYTGRTGICNYFSSQVTARITGQRLIKDLKAALQYGPVVVYLQASLDFQYYKSGIFNGYCSTKYDHAVTAVGWGVENGVEFWIVRNSYGTSWGERGNIRIRINGNCQVYPAVQPIMD